MCSTTMLKLVNRHLPFQTLFKQSQLDPVPSPDPKFPTSNTTYTTIYILSFLLLPLPCYLWQHENYHHQLLVSNLLKTSSQWMAPVWWHQLSQNVQQYQILPIHFFTIRG